MNNLVRRALCALAFTACFALPALADSVAYTDLVPGGSYNGTVFWPVSGLGTGTYQSWADQFTASVSGALSQIDVGLGNVSGTNSAKVSIYADVGDNLGALLFSGTVSNQPASGSSNTTLATLAASSGILTAGGNYFLVVSPGAADTFDGWNFNSIGATGTLLYDNTGSGFGLEGSSLPLSAFDVKVNATVPEPSTYLMVGAELLCLLAVAGWRRSVSVH